MDDTRGEYNGTCNRRACGKAGATYLHKQVKKHYCLRCATLINLACVMRGEERVILTEEDTEATHEMNDSSAATVPADTLVDPEA